jgi:hypothetical protein
MTSRSGSVRWWYTSKHLKLEELSMTVKWNVAVIALCVLAPSSLFGDDPLYYGSEYDGTLRNKTPPEFKVGDWGHLWSSAAEMHFEVLTKINDRECLVQATCTINTGRLRPVTMLVRGFDTTNLTTGSTVSLDLPVVIEKTYDYTAVTGAKRTVLLLEFNKEKLEALAAPERERLALEGKRLAQEREQAAAAREAALIRTWAIKDGNDTQVFVAKFLEYTKKRVYLERKDDGKRVDFHWFNLSKTDQKWVLAQLRDAQPKSKGKTRTAGSRSPSASPSVKSLDQIRVEVHTAEAATRSLMKKRGCSQAVVDYVAYIGNRCTAKGAPPLDLEEMPVAVEVLGSPPARAWIAATEAYVAQVKK